MVALGFDWSFSPFERTRNDLASDSRNLGHVAEVGENLASVSIPRSIRCFERNYAGFMTSQVLDCYGLLAGPGYEAKPGAGRRRR